MPKIDPEIITEVTKFFGVNNISIDPFSFGENSNAYSFSVKDQEYVLRVSLFGHGFILDQLFFKLLKNSIIPIPETVYTGKFKNKYFSISKRIQGKLLIDEDDNTQLSLMGEFLKISHAIHSDSHSVSITGFGPIGENGAGKYQSWRSFIEDQTPSSSTLWLPNYFDKLNQLKLSNFIDITGDKGYIHGDYGYKNIIVKSGKISGVIDWEDAKLGDFVYDIAYIHFWATQTDFQKIFYNFYSSSATLDLKNFKKRFDCYTLYIGISLLNYFASKNDISSFNWIKQKVDEFIGQNSLDGQ